MIVDPRMMSWKNPRCSSRRGLFYEDDVAIKVHKQDMIQVDSFEVNVCQKGVGYEDITLSFGENVVINFAASYIGAEPLTTMIESLIVLEHKDSVKYRWFDEPGVIKFSIERVSSSLLSIRIDYDENECGRDIHEWHILMPYDIYKQGIINASIRALKKYGCEGFNENWSDGDCAMFIGRLISILTPPIEFDEEKDIVRSDIMMELRCLLKHLELTV